MQAPLGNETARTPFRLVVLAWYSNLRSANNWNAVRMTILLPSDKYAAANYWSDSWGRSKVLGSPTDTTFTYHLEWSFCAQAPGNGGVLLGFFGQGGREDLVTHTYISARTGVSVRGEMGAATVNRP